MKANKKIHNIISQKEENSDEVITISFSDGITSRFPIGHLMYMLTSGIVTFLLFPYDLFNTPFESGAPIFESLWKSLTSNFIPFANLENLLKTNSTVDFTVILLAIFVIGVFFYLLKGLFSWINHLPKIFYVKILAWKKELKDFNRKQKLKALLKKLKPFVNGKMLEVKELFFTPGALTQKKLSETEINRKIRNIKFAKWARDNKYKPYLDYIWIFEEITQGIFFVSELLLILLFLVLLPMLTYSFEILATLWFDMFVFTVILSFFSYWLYRVTKRKHNIDLVPFDRMFDDESQESLWKQFD